MNERVLVQIENGVADVRLNRADKMNALDAAMFDGLIATGERLKTEPGLRAVVLSGEGRAFCAGLDMANFGDMASGARRAGASSAGGNLVGGQRTPGGANRAQQAVMVWREVPVPVIAAVHGVAFGGGFQLCLGADLRFVAPETEMSVMELKWGLVPDMGGVALLRHLVRDDVARDLTYSARRFSAEEAHRLGLATRLSPDPRQEALAYAAEIAAKSPDAIRAAKRLFTLALAADQRAVLEAESVEQVALIGSPNQIEAVRANMERRPGRFADGG